MTKEELKYYTQVHATSGCETFHFYLLKWAPKQYYWKETYETRISMAELHWNENKNRIKILSGKKKFQLLGKEKGVKSCTNGKQNQLIGGFTKFV